MSQVTTTANTQQQAAANPRLNSQPPNLPLDFLTRLQFQDHRRSALRRYRLMMVSPVFLNRGDPPPPPPPTSPLRRLRRSFLLCSPPCDMQTPASNSVFIASGFCPVHHVVAICCPRRCPRRTRPPSCRRRLQAAASHGAQGRGGN